MPARRPGQNTKALKTMAHNPPENNIHDARHKGADNLSPWRRQVVSATRLFTFDMCVIPGRSDASLGEEGTTKC